MKEDERLIKGLQLLGSAWPILYDYYKHITTLSLGAILFISAFLTRDNLNTVQSIFIGLSIIGFLISMVLSLKVMKLFSDLIGLYSSIQAITNLGADDISDAESEIDSERMIKARNKVEYLVDDTGKKTRSLNIWIPKIWAAFLAGVLFAACFILVPLLCGLFYTVK